MITMIGFKFASIPYYGWELGLKKHGDTYIHIDEFNANSKYNADCYYQTNLLKPKFNLENFTLWVFPYIVLIIGGFIIIFLIKKRSKNV